MAQDKSYFDDEWLKDHKEVFSREMKFNVLEVGSGIVLGAHRIVQRVIDFDGKFIAFPELGQVIFKTPQEARGVLREDVQKSIIAQLILAGKSNPKLLDAVDYLLKENVHPKPVVEAQTFNRVNFSTINREDVVREVVSMLENLPQDILYAPPHLVDFLKNKFLRPAQKFKEKGSNE
jgi:hypothetical protein